MRGGPAAMLSTLMLGAALLPGVALASAGAAPHLSASQAAMKAYDAGVRALGKARGYEQAQALPQARKAYGSALEQFQLAVKDKDDLFQAWNYIGFTQRHLGNYDAALAAYGRALELNPGYQEAIEYRAEAYLGLNRIEEAKAAYMELFRTARPLSDQLLAAMQRWISERQGTAPGPSEAQLHDFAQWVQERAAIAQQTASLATGRSHMTPADWQ